MAIRAAQLLYWRGELLLCSTPMAGELLRQAWLLNLSNCPRQLGHYHGVSSTALRRPVVVTHPEVSWHGSGMFSGMQLVQGMDSSLTMMCQLQLKAKCSRHTTSTLDHQPGGWTEKDA